MGNMNNLVGSLIVAFNNSNNIDKPNSDYVGSLFFGPNQEIIFRNNIPKGRVLPGETFISDKSFGNGWKYGMNYNVHVDFFTVHGYTSGSGYKNSELINDYFQKVIDTVRSHTGSFGAYVLTDISDEFEPQRIDEMGNNVWGGRKLLVFKERKG